MTTRFVPDWVMTMRHFELVVESTVIQEPALVAVPADPDDVVAVVELAQRHDKWQTGTFGYMSVTDKQYIE